MFGGPWGEYTPDPEYVPEDPRTTYACPGCLEVLDLANVARVELHMGKIRITHQCPRTGWRVTRYSKSNTALRNLFRGDYYLPWSSLNTVAHEDGDTAIAGPEAVPQSRDDVIDSAVLRFAWDLDGVETAHDFLLFCRGPRSTDAQVAARHRRRRLLELDQAPAQPPDEGQPSQH